MQLNAGKILLLFCACLYIIFLSTCNFLFSPLHGRENGDDPEAQIYNLFAYQTGETEVTASFTWRDVFFNYDEDTAIEEAVMVYNVGEALPVRSIPLPPDSGGTIGFEFNDEQYMYWKTVEGVEEGETVWFALYPRTKKKRWLAPLYESIVVDEYPPMWQLEPSIPLYRVYRDGPDDRMQELEPGQGFELHGVFDRYAVLQFDLPKRVRFNSVNLRLNTGGGWTGPAWVYPVTFKYINGIEKPVLLNFVDMDNGIQIDLSVADDTNSTADITPALNAANLYETNTILVTLDPANANTFNVIFGSDQELQLVEYIAY